MKHLLILVLLTASSYASADTYTCEKNGRRVLQGMPCPQGYETVSIYREDRTLLENRRRSEEAAFDAMMKRYEAVNRAQSERMRRDAAVHDAEVAYERERQAEIARQRASVYSGGDGDFDFDEALRGLAGSGGNSTYQAPRPAAPAIPAAITKCYNGSCYDNSGNRYNPQGSGFVRSDGRFCKQFGSQIECF